MLESYVRAVLEERIAPPRLRGLAPYFRWEYGQGTAPEYILVALSRADAERPKGPRANGGVARSFMKVLRTLLPGNGKQPTVPVRSSNIHTSAELPSMDA